MVAKKSVEAQYARLLQRDGYRCHYCDNIMGPKSGRGKRGMSREHVVPQSFGGPNKLDNLVLVCRECNNTRGNQIDYCHCKFCTKATNKYWWDYRFLLLCIVGKPRVYKQYSKWFVDIGGKTHVHDTFEQAHRTLWLRRENEVNHSERHQR